MFLLFWFIIIKKTPKAIVSFKQTQTSLFKLLKVFEAGDFIHTLGDAHLYSNHMDQVATQLAREPLPLPTMRINPEVTNLFDFVYEDFELVGYESHPHIKAPVAV